MNLQQVANLSTIASLFLIATLALIDRWPKVAQWSGPMSLRIILIFLIAVIGIAITGVALYASRQRPLSIDLPTDWETTKKIPVVGKTFVNERVLLDGHSYSNCKFISVTLVYNGTMPFDLSSNNFHGKIIFASDRPQIAVILFVLKELGFLKPETEVFK